MSVWNYIVVGLCLSLLLFLLVKEMRRANRSRLAIRVIATLLAVAALGGIALPLTYSREAAVAGRERILLTEGYQEDSVQFFLQMHPGMPVDTISKELPAIGGRWQVFGYGLTREEWKALRPASLVLHGPQAGGLVAVDWQRRLQKGERLLVQGHWVGRKVKLFLIGLGQIADSVEAGGEFALSVAPAQAGKAVYELVAVAGSDTVEREALPVEVKAARPLKVLLLASSPDFENTFLLNWLSKNGDQAASRTAVSRGKYHLSFVNMEERPLGQLNAALLGAFDLVIADASVLPAAGTAEWVALRHQVEDKGLGLLVKEDSGSVNSWTINDKQGMRALVRDSLGRMVVGCGLDGAGKVVYSKSNTSYSQWMAGKQLAYSAYWTSILGLLARPGEAVEEWSWKPALPRVGEQVAAMVETGKEMPQGVMGAAGPTTKGAEPATVYLAQGAALPFCWQGSYWPEAAGWQSAHTQGGDTAWWYAWPAGAWSGADRKRRREETEEFIRGMGGPVTDGPKTAEVRVEASKGWLYALFLLSMLFLWVERKMGGMNG